MEYSLSERRETRAKLATGHVDAEHAKILLHEKGERVSRLTQDFMRIFEYLSDDFDEDHPLKKFVTLLHTYFSGLAKHIELIKKFHQACNEEIVDLASILPTIFPDVDIQVQLLHDMARSKTFLPDSDEWQNLKDDADIKIPYVLLRLFCLHRDWKEVCTILYKGYRYVTLLDECKEALYEFYW